MSALRTVLEMTVVTVVSGAIAIVANTLNGDGLSLTRDYFEFVDGSQGPSDPVPTIDGDPDGTPEPETEAPAETIEEVTARLAEKGIGVVDHAGMAELFQDELYEYEAYLVVDARNRDKYEAGHIPLAYNFDHFRMEKYEPSYLEEIVMAGQTAMKVIIYCYGVECTDSEITAQHLVNMGIDAGLVSVYVGGMKTWSDANMPIERGGRGSGDIVAAGADDGE